jgi:hypothetical protein
MPISLFLHRHLRQLATSAALSSLALGGSAAVGASPAQASVINLGSCDNSPLSQPFLPWADSSPYKLVPGGDFEGPAAGWSLSGPAAVVAGSEPAGVTGSVGKSSLSLPAGGSAQSPTTCVDAAYPSFRFFARTGQIGSLLAVSVVYQTLLGQTSVPVGLVTLSNGWSPTLPMLTASAVGGLLSGGTAPVALRFTELTGSSQIDDVYVDPHTLN